jgi:hypothetical protein
MDLAPGEASDIEFHFSPTSIGQKTSQIVIKTTSETIYRNIRGNGVDYPFAVNSRIIDFGQVYVGDYKDSTVFVLTNTGTQKITIDKYYLSGPDNDHFKIMNTETGFDLDPNGGSHTFILRFQPGFNGRTSGGINFEYNGFGSPALTQLFGEGLPTINSTLYIKDYSAKVDQRLEIPVYVTGANDLQYLSDSIVTYLKFNATVLVPIGLTPKGWIDNGVRVIPLSFSTRSMFEDSVIAKYQFRTTLGNAEKTEMRLDSARLKAGRGKINTIPGSVVITDICHEGGDRFVVKLGSFYLMQTKPNPVEGLAKINYGAAEKGSYRLTIFDIYGNRKEIIDLGEKSPGEYDYSLDCSSYTTGTYILELKSPNRRLNILMEVVK